MVDRTLTPGTTPTVSSNGNNDPLLIKALRELLDHYVGLVNSGDAGNWDPEKEGEVAQARAALRLANVAPYMNSPIECGHRLARLVCPDCGIDLRGNVLNTSETPEQLRIRLAKDIYDDGQDHHPPGYVGRKGDMVVIHSIQTAVVSHRGTGDGFVVHDGELELSSSEKADEGRPVRPHRSGGHPVSPAFRDERLHRIDRLMDAQPGTPEGTELNKLVDEQVNAESEGEDRG